MLCLGYLHPGRLDSKDILVSSWSMQVLSDICLVKKTWWLMLYPVQFGIPVVAAPGSCHEGLVSPILSVNSRKPMLRV